MANVVVANCVFANKFCIRVNFWTKPKKDVSDKMYCFDISNVVPQCTQDLKNANIKEISIEAKAMSIDASIKICSCTRKLRSSRMGCDGDSSKSAWQF